jgi:hypothetical protein
MGEKRNACRLLVGKPEGKRPLGRPRRRWVYKIRINLGEVGLGDVHWIGVAQDRNRWRALFGIEPSSSMKCWETNGVAQHLVYSRVMLSSIELVSSFRYIFV